MEAERAKDRPKRLPVLFVAGTSYCGSTLLSFLLNAHPQIVSVGEETGVSVKLESNDDFPCSCGATLGQCGFWQDAARRLAEKGMEFSPNHWRMDFWLGHSRLTRHLLTRSLRHNALDAMRDRLVLMAPGWGSRLREIARRNEALIEVILEKTGKRVFAAASKDPIRVRYLNRIPSLDIKVIHLVRDAMGFANSAVKNNRVSCAAGIRTWNRVAAQAERIRRELRRDQWQRIRYEDLCQDVDGTMTRIAEFVGVDRPPRQVAFRDCEHHIIGNRMRLSNSAEIMLDEKWRKELSAEQIALVEARTAHHRRAFGYV